jgi:hypothetical protein
MQTMIRIQQIYTIEKQIISEIIYSSSQEDSNHNHNVPLFKGRNLLKNKDEINCNNNKYSAYYKTEVLLGKIIDIYG